MLPMFGDGLQSYPAQCVITCRPLFTSVSSVLSYPVQLRELLLFYPCFIIAVVFRPACSAQ